MALTRFVLVGLTAGLLCDSFLLLSPSPIQAECMPLFNWG